MACQSRGMKRAIAASSLKTGTTRESTRRDSPSRVAGDSAAGWRTSGGFGRWLGNGMTKPPAFRTLAGPDCPAKLRSEEHTSELQSLMRISYAVFCLKKKNIHNAIH